MGKKSILLILILWNCQIIYAQSLKVFRDGLYFSDHMKFLKVIGTNADVDPQGYELIDSVNIFIAYDAGNAEPLTRISVYNVKNKRETVVLRLGNTGESIFQYNKDNDLVLFNWYNGINVFKLHGSYNDFNYNGEPDLILKCNCYMPFWVDSESLGYNVFENGQWATKYFKLLRKSE